MISNLQFDFLVDKEKKTITVKKEFAANVSLVWDAFTKKEILDQWWAPKPWKSRTKSHDFREGGERLYAMVGPAGEEHWAVFKFQKIDKPNYFSGVDGFTDADGVLNPEMPLLNWKVNFTGKGATTLVEVNISFDTLDQLAKILEMGFKDGFTIALQSLDELLLSLKKK
ncbi:MAG TPA: SRPBCC domain-containing protein [Bacteroidia bacterium]|nr:SRPBCC domain-containing protein [Bacteroidia bacterium]